MKHRIITSHQPCFLLALAALLVVVFFSYNNSAYTTTATTDVVFVESYVLSSSYKYGTSAASIASIGRPSLSSSSFHERSYSNRSSRSSRSRSSSSIYNRSRCCPQLSTTTPPTATRLHSLFPSKTTPNDGHTNSKIVQALLLLQSSRRYHHLPMITKKEKGSLSFTTTTFKSLLLSLRGGNNNNNSSSSSSSSSSSDDNDDDVIIGNGNTSNSNIISTASAGMTFHWTARKIVQAFVVFILAGIAEIGGGWLVWNTVREQKPWYWAVMGSFILVLYGFIPTFQPSNSFGRIYAVYGGFFIGLSYIWGYIFDGLKPDTGDILGSILALAAVLIILFWPRKQ